MTHRQQDGFSLVEVIVALGLLAAVLISISGLFVFSERLVKSGKSHSTALSVARHILEEMNGWTFRELYARFGLSGSAAAYAVDTRTNGLASRWQPLLDDDLRGSYAKIALDVPGSGVSGPALADAEAIRIRVTVFWEEGLRAREVQLATVRM